MATIARSCSSHGRWALPQKDREEEGVVLGQEKEKKKKKKRKHRNAIP